MPRAKSPLHIVNGLPVPRVKHQRISPPVIEPKIADRPHDPTVESQLSTANSQVPFEPIKGRAAIAQVFGKSTTYFWDVHGKELFKLGIVFKLRYGRPYRLRVAAFPSELIRWAAFKAQRGEVI